MTVITAKVLNIMPNQLLVRQRNTGQVILVHSPAAMRFRAAQIVQICYNGIMTRSLPPQITAERIVILL